ncbi:MAG TPA: carbohydrate-binding family 9-like protein [Myxococcota bacterium]|nr:carbohydrate-binding family 9-like protein [Myxococcota bacterium]
MKSGRILKTLLVVALAAVMAASFGCKRPVRLVLSKDQQNRIRESILTTAPTPKHVVNANFGDAVQLIGIDMEPENPRAGQEVTVTWYWQSKRAVVPGWKVFVHLELPRGKRMGLDHVPVGELYPMDQWAPGQYVKYTQKVKLEPKAEAGRAEIWAGLYSADVYGAKGTGERMVLVNRDQVKNDGENRVSVHQFNVTKAAVEQKPATDMQLALTPVVNPAVKLDGVMDEEAWKGAALIGRLSDAFGRPIEGEEQTSVRVMHDGEFLYFGVAATDQSIEATLTSRDQELWTQDVFEIYLDGQMDGKEYLEIQVSPANVVFDALFAEHRVPEWKLAAKHTVPGLESAVKVDGTLNVNGDRDRGWTMEIKIPASSVPGLKIVEGAELRVNFYRMNIQDGSTGRAHAWGPGGRDFHDLSKAGVIVFNTAVPVVEAKKN